MSKEMIGKVKEVADKIKKPDSLIELLDKQILGLEDTLRYRFPVSAETRAYYESIEKGVDIDEKVKDGKKELEDLKDKYKDSKNSIAQQEAAIKKAKLAYDTESNKRSGNNGGYNAATLATAASDYEDEKAKLPSLQTAKKELEEKIKEKEQQLSPFKGLANLGTNGIPAQRLAEMKKVQSNVQKFTINHTPLTHQTITLGDKPLELDLKDEIFTSVVPADQRSYVFYDEQAHHESKDGKPAAITAQILLRDGSFKEVKIKGLAIEGNKLVSKNSNNKNEIQIEGVSDDDYPLQIRSLSIRGILQDGGQSYYMDKKISLTINKGASAYNKKDILEGQPGATTKTDLHNQFLKVFPGFIAQDYKKLAKDLWIDNLNKHPDFAALPEHQKNDLYKKLSQQEPFKNIFTKNTQNGYVESIENFSANPLVMKDSYELFSKYLVADKLEPKASADDLKSKVSYTNWVARNMTPLMQSFIKKYMADAFADASVTGKVNTAITDAVIHHQNKTLDSADPQKNREYIKSITGGLRAAVPKGASNKGLNKWTGKNNSWMRLMAGKSASVSDSVMMADGKEKKYSSQVTMRAGKGISVQLTLPDGKPLIFASSTPGDLLAKILESARITDAHGGQRMRLMMAFGTMKALIKMCRDAGIAMTVPINGSRDELRLSLSADDKLHVAKYEYDAGMHELKQTKDSQFIFDEKDPEQKSNVTDVSHNFMALLNNSLNTIMDNEYEQLGDTLNKGASRLHNLGRWLTRDRGRMSYKTDPRFLRGAITKLLNRKEQSMEGFSFPIQTGNVSGTVSYEPNGTISIDIGGKVRKGKNLARLLNPRSFRMFWGVFQKKNNMTDGMELEILQGIYSNLSAQLMQNSRVNKYTYLVRDPKNGVVYACYLGADGAPRMGIIEHTDQNSMFLMSRQKRGRCVGMPEQGVRELDAQETQALLARPDIMDGFMQNMIKAREEIVRVPTGGYRSASFTGMIASELAIVGAIGGVDLAIGGLMSSSIATAAHAVGDFTTSTLLPGAANVAQTAASSVAQAIKGGYHVGSQAVKGVVSGMGDGSGLL